MARRNVSIEVRAGEHLNLELDGKSVTITLVEKSGQRARLAINADDQVEIGRPKQAHTGAAQARLGIKSA